jgi:hypothetical protein
VTNSLAILAPNVAAQLYPTKNGSVTPADVTSQTNKKYLRRCDRAQTTSGRRLPTIVSARAQAAHTAAGGRCR